VNTKGEKSGGSNDITFEKQMTLWECTEVAAGVNV